MLTNLQWTSGELPLKMQSKTRWLRVQCVKAIWHSIDTIAQLLKMRTQRPVTWCHYNTNDLGGPVTTFELCHCLPAIVVLWLRFKLVGMGTHHVWNILLFSPQKPSYRHSRLITHFVSSHRVLCLIVVVRLWSFSDFTAFFVSLGGFSLRLFASCCCCLMSSCGDLCVAFNFLDWFYGEPV